jgi:hypothetical protein
MFVHEPLKTRCSPFQYSEQGEKTPVEIVRFPGPNLALDHIPMLGIPSIGSSQGTSAFAEMIG